MNDDTNSKDDCAFERRTQHAELGTSYETPQILNLHNFKNRIHPLLQPFTPNDDSDISNAQPNARGDGSKISKKPAVVPTAPTSRHVVGSTEAKYLGDGARRMGGSKTQTKKSIIADRRTDDTTERRRDGEMGRTRTHRDRFRET